MCDHMVKELTVGCLDQPDIKAGFIGEIGITYPMTGKSGWKRGSWINKLSLPIFFQIVPSEIEKRSIRAAAAAQLAVGAPVSFHPGRNPDSAFDIMRVFLEAGGKADRMILSHTESKLTKLPTIACEQIEIETSVLQGRFRNTRGCQSSPSSEPTSNTTCLASKYLTTPTTPRLTSPGMENMNEIWCKH